MLTLRAADNFLTVWSEARQHPVLQLSECGDIHAKFLVEKPNPATNDRTSIQQWKKRETKTRSNIIFACDVVAIETYTVIDRQPAIHGPLVLEVGQKLCLVAAKLITPNKVELLTACAVGPQNAHSVAGVTPIKSNVVNCGAYPYKVFARKFRWSEAIDFQRLVSLTLAGLLIEKVSRVHVRGKIHRRSTRTGEDVGIELLDAER